MLALAIENIFDHGGHSTTDGVTRLYHVPTPEALVTDPEKPNPIGPSGLVGRARAAGITVTPTASVAYHSTTHDRYNLDSIADGITDNSHNGHKPYYTRPADPASRPNTDWYELSFSEPVRFSQATFYEGDIVWGSTNRYYVHDTPRGGYFEDLTVQIRQGDHYVEPADLAMSAELDRFQMYQRIAFSFAPTVGEAIRVLGTPSGSERYTTILELELEGELYEGPHVVDVRVGDGGRPLSDVSDLVVQFSDPVAVGPGAFVLHGTGRQTVVGADDVVLFQSVSGRYLLLALIEPLGADRYELRVDCPAVTDGYAMIKVLTQRGYEGNISLVVNFASDRHEARSTFNRVSAVARQFLGVKIFDGGYLLTDQKVAESVRIRQPLVLAFPRSLASRGLAALANRLRPSGSLLNTRLGFFRRLASWFA